MIKASEFIHPEDAAALRQLESIPGFPAFVKRYCRLVLSKCNMVSTWLPP